MTKKQNNGISDVSRGGVRQGAGRKKGSGKFGEPTKVMRIPQSKVSAIQAWLNLQNSQSLQSAQDIIPSNQAQSDSPFVWHLPPEETEPAELPLYAHKVVAGFPSPAEDYIEARLDLNEKLIRNKEATFLLSVQGDSMKDVGILDGDILVVDRSIEPQDGKIVIAALDGELTVKRLSMKSTGTWLVPENENYPPILVRESSDIVIWGVVTATISQF
ncbi:LexA family transcriptional regulator [Thiomicrorhabdus sp. Milos-T2]|uniref:LexA family protein n=1 Tax=Thiomicrorhabdus sp. Milos-T2 TaxID=90814 RepID=UPI0004943E3A|nr:translesion error-prone DNA polymerase V autoproteolytic subunit [Thiomicrorhabdus sp. Milos-T2]